MAGSKRRIFLRLVAAWTFLVIFYIAGAEDIYSNSFISPNSARDPIVLYGSEATGMTSGPSEINEESKTQSISSENTRIHNGHSIIRPVRSPNPILQKPNFLEEMTSFKNVNNNLDTNDVELTLSGTDFIQPSRTIKEDEEESKKRTKQVKTSGEYRGAPRGKSIPLLEPHELRPTATIPPNFVTQYPPPIGRARQVNPDIQEIITGIVKLLNGNVNVQANTAPAMGRPLRPLSTRINNRGPPRITDLPALPPDFDVPAPPLPPPPLGQMPPPVSSTRMPTPYPFDIPHQNTSPVRPFINGLETGKRPGFYRPVTIPPWNRPPQRRPGPHRRPPLPYKPIPNYNTDNTQISITSDKPMEDILNLDLGTHLQSNSAEMLLINETIEEALNETVSGEVTTDLPGGIIEIEDKETIEFEKNKEKSSSKMEKHTTLKPSTVVDSTLVSNSTVNASTIQPTKSEDIKQTAMKNSSEITNKTIETIKNETVPILESSIQEVVQTLKSELLDISATTNVPTESLPSINSTSKSLIDSTVNQTSQGFPYYPYRPRPGIVLDDTEYKPGGIHRQPIVTRPPIGDIFDITVSAIQGPASSGNAGQGKPYVVPVDIESIHQGHDVITSPVAGEGFVSIDGKRTYLNLFGENSPPTSVASVISPTSIKSEKVTGTGYAVVEVEKPHKNLGKTPEINVKTTTRRPLYNRPQPPVRIDTCIVGDDSTCDGSQHEICKTESGVSACHCRPGHARRKHRDPCRKVVSVLVSIRVDRLYERRVVWAKELADSNSERYQQLAFETERALESAMSMTPFSDEFLSARVNSIYKGDRASGQAGVFVNLTLQLEENSETSRPTIRGDIQRHLLGVIQRRSHNIGNSAVWVETPAGAVSNLQDLDECTSPELHDCHALAKCINVFGGFKCECGEGFRDAWADNRHRAGRHCEQCSPQHCNNRGECKYQNGQEVCICTGNYYGNQCELDGEVLGVAIGASIAAIIIIGLTLVCLVMWSRRWSREQKAAVGSPVFGYMATASNTVKTPPMGGPPYHLTLEDRLRWAQIADVMAQTNHYAPEPVTGPTRPSSAMFGYPNIPMMGTLQHGTLPPVPLPRLNLHGQFGGRAASVPGVRPLDNSSSSEEEDKADLLGRNFQVPRPKSRSNASIANQSGIYYDVDYEPNDIYKHQGGGIPMSTYGARTAYYRN